jgi:hypothetical protein
MSRDTDENFHPVETSYDLDSGIDALRLAVDMCHEADRVEHWKQIATALARALNTSGWTPQSGGTEAIERFKRLLREEARTSVRVQPTTRLGG